MEQVEVLIGNTHEGAFNGFKARFRGELVVSYEVEDGLIYTLYKCGWGDYEGYRVYKVDEANPFNCAYELTPYEPEDPLSRGTEYYTLYEARDIVSYFPMFARYVDFLETRDIDPKEGRRWSQDRG